MFDELYIYTGVFLHCSGVKCTLFPDEYAEHVYCQQHGSLGYEKNYKFCPQCGDDVVRELEEIPNDERSLYVWYSAILAAHLGYTDKPKSEYGKILKKFTLFEMEEGDPWSEMYLSTNKYYECITQFGTNGDDFNYQHKFRNKPPVRLEKDFREQYKEEIKQLRKIFDTVKVYYGVVNNQGNVIN